MAAARVRGLAAEDELWAHRLRPSPTPRHLAELPETPGCYSGPTNHAWTSDVQRHWLAQAGPLTRGAGAGEIASRVLGPAQMLRLLGSVLQRVACWAFEVFRALLATSVHHSQPPPTDSLLGRRNTGLQSLSATRSRFTPTQSGRSGESLIADQPNCLTQQTKNCKTILRFFTTI